MKKDQSCFQALFWPCVDGVLLLLAGAVVGYMFLATLDVVLHRDIVLMADALLRLEEWLFHLPLFLGMFAIAGARMGWRHAAMVLCLGFGANECHFFTDYVHHFLSGFELYPAFARHPGVAANVQWPILLAYGVCWPILLGQVLWRKTRHLGRVFVLVMMTATLCTTFLFHQLVIGGALKNTLVDARERQMLVMRHLIDHPGDAAAFAASCRAFQIWCAQAAPDQPPPDPPDDFADWVARSAMAPAPLMIERRGFSPLNRTLNGQQALYVRTPAFARWAVDAMPLTPVVARHKIIFALLVSVAHLVWCWGGMALLALHRSPLRFHLRGRP